MHVFTVTLASYPSAPQWRRAEIYRYDHDLLWRLYLSRFYADVLPTDGLGVYGRHLAPLMDLEREPTWRTWVTRLRGENRISFPFYLKRSIYGG